MKETPKKNDRHLDDFLRRAAKGELHDDFEREAAEGFSTLPDSEDPRDIMASTDRKMEAALDGQKKTVIVYWGMAAGLLLVLGLTVFLLRDSGTLDTERQLGQAGHARTDAVFRETPVATPRSQDNAGSSNEPAATPKTKQVLAEGVKTQERPMTENVAPEVREEQVAPVQSSGEALQEVTAKVTNTAPPSTADAETGAAEAGPGPMQQAAREKKMATNAAPSSVLSLDMAAPEPAARSGATPHMAFSGGDLVAITACLDSTLRRNLPAGLQKKFSATAVIMNGKITAVKFPRRSGLTGPQEKQADSVITAIGTPCVRNVKGNEEKEIFLNYRP